MRVDGVGLLYRLYNTNYPPAIASAVPFDGTQHVLPHVMMGPLLQIGSKSGYIDESIPLSNLN